MQKHSGPEFARILDWLEGKLPEEEAAALAAQLAAAGEETLADLNWLRSFLELSRKNKLASPPPELRHELRRLFVEYAGEHRPQNAFRRMLASLTFDSRSQMAAAGLRSADITGAQAQLIFSTPVAEVALNFQTRPQDQHINLLGQVFPLEDRPMQAFSVQLLSGAQEAGLASSDELGEFAFEGIPAGTYDLILSTDTFEVLIPSIQLQS